MSTITPASQERSMSRGELIVANHLIEQLEVVVPRILKHSHGQINCVGGVIGILM